jgi:Hydrolases of the alpha/beta superfamily
MLFHPYTDVDKEKLAIVENVHGRELALKHGMSGWFYQIPESKYVVLFSHGNAGNISHRIHKVANLLRCGQSVLIWDYPGFGNSKGHSSLKTIGDEAVSVYDSLISLGYKPNQVVLYGESLGAGINSEISQNRKVKAVIVDSGFTSLHEVAREKIPIFHLYPSFLLPPQAMKLKDSLKDIPCLIIHGQKDFVIPYHNGVDLAAAAPKSKFISLPNSEHNFVTDEDTNTVQAALKEFFERL